MIFGTIFLIISTLTLFFRDFKYKKAKADDDEQVVGGVRADRRSVISQNAELTLVKAWTDYAEEIEADIRAFIPFIDDLQGSFNSHEKAILLKRSAFQIYLLRRIRALNPNELLLSDGRVIKVISLHILYGTSLINEMLKVVNRILQMGCTDKDIAMFITIVYYKPRRIEDLFITEKLIEFCKRTN